MVWVEKPGKQWTMRADELESPPSLKKFPESLAFRVAAAQMVLTFVR